MSARTLANLRLNIDAPMVSEVAVNFRLPSWPPPSEFPVIVDKDGLVVSRYGDAIWDLSPWDRVPKVVNFGDGPLRKGAARISAPNANTFRMVAAWWLWGIGPVRTASTFVAQHQLLRNVFAFCTREGIDARELSRYPAMAERLASELPAARGEFALALLHMLYEQRDDLGFTLLDFDGLRRLEACLSRPPENSQTAYIPPRIWAYQVTRLRTVLDDFNLHAEQLEAFYQNVLAAYAKEYGTLLATTERATRQRFSGGRGAFERLAQDCGVDQLLLRWYPSEEKEFKYLPVYALSNYLTLVNRVGLAYLLNFSLMRIQEAWSLRTDCLHLENDETLGEIALLRGETTKTVHDDDAWWITSPSVAIAVKALGSISRWRQKVKEAYGEYTPDAPKLIQASCEPWTRRPTKKGRRDQVNYPSYADVLSEHPKLLDPEELRITQEDWNLAKLITPTLDEDRFGVGKAWSFGWHQLRRTGAVNMQASGLVSNFSLQYQLKHSILASSLYYGQGYSRLSLNRTARAEYVRTMYELMGKELNQVFSDRFVSPYGPERKEAIFQIVPQSDHKKLMAAAKAGRVAWRMTLLGVCTKTGPCEYGGIDNIIRCGGGDNRSPCMDALFDQDRRPTLQRLSESIAEKLKSAESGSPYHQSLEAQRRSLENALNVLKGQ